MNEIKKTLSDLKLWASLHIIIGFGVPVVLLFFFGCKEIEEEQAPLGVPVEAAAIEAELQKALEGTSVHSVLKDQQVVFELNQAIENQSIKPYLYVKQHVIELQDTPQYFSFTYNEITEDPNADPGTKPKVVEKQSPRYIPKPTAGLMTLQEQGFYNLQNIKLYSEERAEYQVTERPVVKVTYHDLYVEQQIQAPPPFVQRAPDCRGIPECKIRVTRIRFDQANWYSENEYSKIQYSLDISPDVPYLGKVVSDCLATVIPYEERTIYIKECQQLLDFAFGQ